MSQGPLIFLVILWFGIFAADVHAAKIYIVPDVQVVTSRPEFNVDIRLDTKGKSINAAQALIGFSPDIVSILSAEKENSIFSFWLEEPQISNASGTLRLIGGTTKKITGDGLHILRLRAQAKKSGLAEFAISDAAVIASDGEGSNILSSVERASVDIKLTAALSTSSMPVSAQGAFRISTAAKALPPKPILNVPLYPDQTRWYNHKGDVVVFWNSVPDVQAAIWLDRNPGTGPTKVDKELQTGRNIGAIPGDGIWYLHVRFKNTVGFGDTAHYKISFDTTVPSLSLLIDTPSADYPSPKLRFEAKDYLSGLSHAVISLDGREEARSIDSTYVLPPQSPGKYRALVRVFDRAGNSAGESIDFEILPIPAPQVDFFTRKIEDDESILIFGHSAPDQFVDVILRDKEKEVLRKSVATNSDGGWSAVIVEDLARGRYSFAAVARDKRGASSHETEPREFLVRSQVIVSMAGIDFGWNEITLAAILITIAGGIILVRHRAHKRRVYSDHKADTASEVEKFTYICEYQLKKLHDYLGRADQATADSLRTEIAASLRELGEMFSKLKHCLKEIYRPK